MTKKSTTKSDSHSDGLNKSTRATSAAQATSLENAAPVRLYIVRHAHAVAAEENPERPLSKRGRRQVKTLGAFLEESSAFRPGEIWHSPLARARETAQGLAQALDLDVPLVEITALESGADPQVIAPRLHALQTSVAIVGHEPHLSALASLLVTGASAPKAFILKKCSALALERDEAHWAVRWQVSPEILE